MRSSRTGGILIRMQRSRVMRFCCAFLVVNLLVEICAPPLALALTAGPHAPEFSSFEPVATTDMVSDFTGDFSYNLPVLSIPGPDGGGYSLSLSYHSGVSSEEEASWVGFGWTLNPGAINRQEIGIPDDFKGVEIKEFNKFMPNWTQSATFDIGMEFNSQDKKNGKQEGTSEGSTKNNGDSKKLFFNKVADKDKKSFDLDPNAGGNQATSEPAEISISFQKSIRYNPRGGFSIATNFGANVKGMASLNMSMAGGENTYGGSINPMGILRGIKDKQKTSLYKRLKDKLESKSKTIARINQGSEDARTTTGIKSTVGFPQTYSIPTYNAPALPYSVIYNIGRSFNFRGSVEINPAGPLGFQIGLSGNINTQINIPEIPYQAYGYMYNPDYQLHANALKKTFEDVDKKSIIKSDFQLEKATTFEKHDRNLGIPFNTADLYSATGNGVVGGFRFHHDKIGHYYPNFVTNKQKVRQLGIELGIGQTLQIGFDVGLGSQKTVVSAWKDAEGLFEFEEPGKNLPFFQFTNDPGGVIQYSVLGNAIAYYPLTSIDGASKTLNLSSLSQNTDRRTSVEGQTSHIDYAWYADNGTLQNQLDNYADFAGPAGQIAQIAITNEEGAKSTYGLPVYTRNNLDLTVGLDDFKDGEYLAYQETNVADPTANKTAMGRFIAQKYASGYLLTQTNGVDYVDANGNKLADEQDFGGWTRFHYRQANGGKNWYRHRAPYTGLIYQRGRLFDPRDQTGSMSSGENERYYLFHIDTKTHIAFFITNKTTTDQIKDVIQHASKTPLSAAELDQIANALKGSGMARLDGRDAAPANVDPSSGGDPNDPAADDPQVKGPNEMEKLERIVLFSKYDFTQAIQTTFFDYDYSLCKRLPNSTATDTNKSGKLTLKKVWTESNGAYKARIAPYQFEYAYLKSIPPEFPQELMNKYGPLFSAYNQIPDAQQNPDYQPEALDMWGYYQLNGVDRFEKMQPWLDQKPGPPTFDPAAWQLKRIKLPSGGEILVQYEQKDYLYVQDKRAMVMAPLRPHQDEKNGYEANNNRYYVNLEAIGITTLNDKQEYLKLLLEHFIVNKEKIYFRMLYGLTGGEPINLVSKNQLKTSEYITGYTVVDGIVFDGNDIYFELGEDNAKKQDKTDKTLPRWVGRQTLLSEAGQNLGMHSGNWDEIDDEIFQKAYYKGEDDPKVFDILENPDKPLKEISKSRALPGTFKLFGDWVGGDIRNKSKSESCTDFNHQLSYFKLPTYHAKKGGGIRVKRLMSFDPGIEQGDAMLYGSEYIYKNIDGTSSGVATNEPPEGREENALVTFMERKKQKWMNKMLNGRDAKVFEGPLGESLLPGASVAYERVVIKNIHDGVSSTGYQVNEYHTVRTFPSVRVIHSELSKKSDTYKKFRLNLPLGLFNYSTNKSWMTQDYLFVMDDMHGKIKRQATYAGNYNPGQFMEAAYTSATMFDYSKPGEPIKTLAYDPVTKEFSAQKLLLGDEEDISMYMSRVHDLTNDFNLELDLNIMLCCGISLGFGLGISFSEAELSQHMTSKVLRRKTFLLATHNMTDGVTQTTENLAFNRYTGQPVLTRTYDGFTSPVEPVNLQKSGGKHQGYYVSMDIPASWIYPQMGQKYLDNTRHNQLKASAGSIVTYGGGNPLATLQADNKWQAGTINNVVSASATVYDYNWFDPVNSANPIIASYFAGLTPTQESDAKAALNKQYYPKRTYVFRSDVSDANNQARIYNGGLFTLDEFFDYSGVGWNYNNPLVGSKQKWFSPSKVNFYSPHGYPLQEEDALGIKSVAKFGYDNMLPVLVAQNASLESVYFIDFEYPTGTFSVGDLDDATAHSGDFAFNFSSAPQKEILQGVKLTEQMLKKGASIKLWLRSNLTNYVSHPNYGLKNPNPQLRAAINGQLYSFEPMAQTGDWTLYEAIITDWKGLQQGSLFNIKLLYNFMGNEDVRIDDFRFQPLDAVMNCTVYYNDFKVAAQFDDQHFGVLYRYNSEGQLTGKSIETERGLKTLQEQQYNIPMILR